MITLPDICLKEFNLDNLPLVKKLRSLHFKTQTEVCIERAELITEFLKNNKNSNDDSQVTRAKAVNHYLSNRKIFFHDDNLIGGATTSKAIGAPLYPEFMGLSIWAELDTISSRATNPQKLTEEAAEKCNFDIFPYWMDNTVLEKTRKKFNSPLSLQLLEKIVYYISGKAGCISHCVPDYSRALNEGLEIIINEAKAKENTNDFYKAVQVSLQGIINYAKNISETAKELSLKEKDELKRKNLEQIAEICSHVPAKPARNFREAMNSLWLCQVGIHAENINMAMSPGRIDKVLYPFFKKDFEAKKITIEEAVALGCCLWLKIADNTNLVPEAAEKLWGGAGATPAVTLGGIDENGNDSVNDLTYIFLKVTELMCLRDPSVNARYNYEKNDKKYRQRVSEVIFNTKAIPAFHNDIADIETLTNQGEKTEDARDFAIVGCVELASTGKDYVASSSIMFNLASVMELTLFDGRKYTMGNEQVGPKTGNPATFSSFQQFYDAFRKQLEWMLKNAIDINEKMGSIHQEMLPTPLLSSFFKGPMETGKDLIFGGAIYNSSGASFLAFPDICDSLNAIEQAVFIEKKCTMQEIIDAIKNNFSDPASASLQAYLKNKIPRFGNENPVSLKNSKQLVKDIYQILQSHTNYRGGKYRPAFWTMTTHAGQGKLSGALPSGRKAKEVFSSGITPASQAAKSLTEAFNSVASLDSKNIPGGWALNIKYTPLLLNENKEEYLNKFGDLVEGFFRNGGMQVQFNIQDYETLIDAKKNPVKYPEMIVRVSGYSAYFKDLNDAMKDELITRTQYNLFSGKAVPFNENNS
ncbi:MAG: pyruvate formate lyase family protein [Bacteroidales bacterium]|nr:pyruvate formate lyase family protein [Bacteroidales bacterium]